MLLGFFLSLFLQLLLFLLLAGLFLKDIQLDSRLDLRLFHLVSVGKREGTAKVGKLTGSLQATLGYGAVADHLHIDIPDLDKLIRSLRHVGRHLTNGQLAAQLTAHDGRTGLGDVEPEVSIGRDGTDVRHIHDLTQLDATGLCTSVKILVVLVQCEVEVDVAGLGLYQSLKLLLLPQHIERPLIVQRTQLVELLHHELLDRELIDDALLLTTLDDSLADIEVYPQGVLVFQAADGSLSLDTEQPARACHRHVAEAHALVVALHAHTEVQWQREVTQHRGKRLGDVLQYRRTADGRGGITELGPRLLVGEVEVAALKVQLCLALLYLDILQLHALLVGRHLAQQLTDVNARHAVLCRQLADPSMYRTIRYAVNDQLHVGPDIKVSDVEEATLGLAGILAGQVVVSPEVQPVQVYQPLAVLLRIAELLHPDVVGDQLSLLVRALPTGLHVLHPTLGCTVARLGILHVAQRHTVAVVLHLQTLCRQLVHDEGQLLLFLCY